MPLVVVGAMLAISGPSMIIAWLELRRRNIGPILDANGWAVNARALMNIPFGASLTSVAELPANAERSLSDPFAEEPTHWRRYVLPVLLFVAFIVAWQLGYAKTWVQALIVKRPVPAAVGSAAASASAAPPAPSAAPPK